MKHICSHPSTLLDLSDHYGVEMCKRQNPWALNKPKGARSSRRLFVPALTVPCCGHVVMVPHEVSSVNPGLGDPLNNVWEVTGRVMANSLSGLHHFAMTRSEVGPCGPCG